MMEPTLQGLQAPPTSGESTTAGAGVDTTEYTSQQKLAAVAGVVLIGAYVGYSLTQSYGGDTPQAFWAHAPTPATPRTAPHIAFVNLHDETRAAAREGVRAWLSLSDEVQLTFPTVMFVEEEETSTFAEISGYVRRATLFAHAELQRGATSARNDPSSTPAAAASRCTVVYRCVTEVEGQPLEDWDVEAPALRRWHGKPFQQRHCLGFTVDGRTTTVLLQDVSGVLLTSRSQAPTSPVKTPLHDGAALLRECGVPSTTTFQSWWPPSVRRAAPSSSSSMLSTEPVAAAAAGEKAEALKVFTRNGRHASLWRSPFALFALLGAVLRYGRTDAAVYPRLLSSHAASPFAIGSAWWRRWRCRLLPSWLRGWAGEREDNAGGPAARRGLLSAPFLLLVRVVEGSPALTAEVTREVQAYTVQWVRHIATLAPKHEAALTEVYRESGCQWCLRVDLTRVLTSVLEAEWLLTHVVALLAAAGVPLSSARLVAVPETPTAASLLYPTAESASLPHYWRPQKPSTPTSGASAAMSAKAAGAFAASAHPGWMHVELRSGQRTGFVVAHHDLNPL